MKEKMKTMILNLLKENEIISIDMLENGTVKVGNIEYKIMCFSKNRNNIYISANKLLVYAILNMTGNVSIFKLNDYMNSRNLSDKKSARQLIKNDLQILQYISNIMYTSKNGQIQTTSSIITDTDYCYGVIKIIFNNEFATQLNLLKVLIKLKEKEVKQ